MKPVVSTKVVLLIALLLLCYFSSFNGAYAGNVRTDPFGIHASDLSHENLVNIEKEEKLKDDEDLVSMDYTAPRRKPPIHN
ncbi:hypothetical protein VNO77_33834 [Canavalia gladiata]|uniref:Uncharacterized protein n=1 Tax=Canavalia gladiata TaxID=3824 RepID=A0AAN9KGF7_CANGL